MAFQGNSPLVADVVLAEPGTAAQPSISIGGDLQNSSGLGFYLASPGVLGLAVGGVAFASWSASSGAAQKGTTTNDSAAAGFVGQILSSSKLRSVASALTTATPVNVVSLSLTAGDWDVVAMVGFTPDTTTSVTSLSASISVTTGALSAADTLAVSNSSGEVRSNWVSAANVLNGDMTLATLKSRVSLAATTTYYLVTQAGFSVSTLAAYGSIVARRVR